MSIADNIQQRRDAEEIMELCGERPPHFWEVLRDMAAAQLPQPARKKEDDEMTERDIARFLRRTFPRGMHAGRSVWEVGTDYIALWLDQSIDEFTRELRRYSQTAHYRERVRYEESRVPEFLRNS